jgi:hypothetical protein
MAPFSAAVRTFWLKLLTVRGSGFLFTQIGCAAQKGDDFAFHFDPGVLIVALFGCGDAIADKHHLARRLRVRCEIHRAEGVAGCLPRSPTARFQPQRIVASRLEADGHLEILEVAICAFGFQSILLEHAGDIFRGFVRPGGDCQSTLQLWRSQIAHMRLQIADGDACIGKRNGEP